MRDFFGSYVSATAAGMGTQSCFVSDGKTHVSRSYYRLSVGGKNEFAFLYSNTTDGTFADGSFSKADTPLPEWTVHSLRAGVCKAPGEDAAPVPVTFEKSASKRVLSGELFASDGVVLEAEKGDFLLLEIEFSGSSVPCHPEHTYTVQVKGENGFAAGSDAPVPSMIGVKKSVRSRVTFWGDSITQGCGTPTDSYSHYAALVADALGEDYAVWDIGMGYARAADAAKLGAWAEKARHSDVVSVCFGVNDVYRNYTAEETAENIRKIVRFLKAHGVRVLVQTVPVFNYENAGIRAKWEYVNRVIKEEISKEADAYFDNTPVLGLPETPYMSAYGAHPDSRGHAAWAKALLSSVRSVFD